MLSALALTLFVTGNAPPPPPTPPANPPVVVKDKVDVQVKETKEQPNASHSDIAPKKMQPVTDKDYTALVVAPHKGKTLIVNFWASYCLPCIKEIPDLQALDAEQKDVDVVFVSADPPSQQAHALAMLKRRNITIASFVVGLEEPEPFLQLIDKDWGGELPYSVIYDAEGNVFQKMPGQHPKDEFVTATQQAAQKKKK